MASTHLPNEHGTRSCNCQHTSNNNSRTSWNITGRGIPVPTESIPRPIPVCSQYETRPFKYTFVVPNRDTSYSSNSSEESLHKPRYSNASSQTCFMTESVSSSATWSVDLEKAEPPIKVEEVKEEPSWSYTQDIELPRKREPGLVRNLRYIIFIMYRRLFSLAILGNIALIVTFALKDWSKNSQYLALASIVNLLVSSLMRSEIFINCMYGIICRIPQSWPLFIRKHAASVYHFGGLHSGCAIASTLWLIYLSYMISFHGQGIVQKDTQILTWFLVGYLVLMCSFAYPRFRVLFHNQFEIVHRFAGWTALAFVWAQCVLLTRDLRPEEETTSQALLRNPGLYCLIIITLIIIYPWLHLRKVPIRIEKLSNHCIRMHFDYRTATAGSFQRISTSPLLEWHSFAAISKPGVGGYSLVISKAGDWTSKIIANPPEKIWVRGIPTDGVLRISPLFRKLIVIGTGSGIGPLLAVLMSRKTSCRVIWTTPNPRETFQNKIVDDVLSADPNAIIHNTRKYGKPDLVKMAYTLYREAEAEGVVIISNTPTTKKVVYGLETRGVPAYGAIWDS